MKQHNDQERDSGLGQKQVPASLSAEPVSTQMHSNDILASVFEIFWHKSNALKCEQASFTFSLDQEIFYPYISSLWSYVYIFQIGEAGPFPLKQYFLSKYSFCFSISWKSLCFLSLLFIFQCSYLGRQRCLGTSSVKLRDQIVVSIPSFCVSYFIFFNKNESSSYPDIITATVIVTARMNRHQFMCVV